MVQTKPPTAVSGDDSAWSKTGAGTTVACTSSSSASPDDAKYVGLSGGGVLRVKMTAADNPNEPQGLKVVIRARSDALGGELVARFYQAVSLIYEWPLTDVHDFFENFEYTLPDAEALTLTDFADLYVEAEIGSNIVEISVFEEAVPDRRMHVHLSG